MVRDGKGVHEGHSHRAQLSAQILHQPVDGLHLQHTAERQRAGLSCLQIGTLSVGGKR